MERLLWGLPLLWIGYWLGANSWYRILDHNAHWWDWLRIGVGLPFWCTGFAALLMGHLWPPKQVCSQDNGYQQESESHLENVSQKRLGVCVVVSRTCQYPSSQEFSSPYGIEPKPARDISVAELEPSLFFREIEVPDESVHIKHDPIVAYVIERVEVNALVDGDIKPPQRSVWGQDASIGVANGCLRSCDAVLWLFGQPLFRSHKFRSTPKFYQPSDRSTGVYNVKDEVICGKGGSRCRRTYYVGRVDDGDQYPSALTVHHMVRLASNILERANRDDGCDDANKDQEIVWKVLGRKQAREVLLREIVGILFLAIGCLLIYHVCDRDRKS